MTTGNVETALYNCIKQTEKNLRPQKNFVHTAVLNDSIQYLHWTVILCITSPSVVMHTYCTDGKKIQDRRKNPFTAQS